MFNLGQQERIYIYEECTFFTLVSGRNYNFKRKKRIKEISSHPSIKFPSAKWNSSTTARQKSALLFIHFRASINPSPAHARYIINPPPPSLSPSPKKEDFFSSSTHYASRRVSRARESL